MANNWTREELIIAFNLYCKIPFSKSVKTNPEVIKVANLVGRTPSSVAFKRRKKQTAPKKWIVPKCNAR